MNTYTEKTPLKVVDGTKKDDSSKEVSRHAFEKTSNSNISTDIIGHNNTLNQVENIDYELKKENVKPVSYDSLKESEFLKVNSIIIPKPFIVENGMLYIEITKGSGERQKTEKVFVCRHVPLITKQFENIENNKVFRKLSWTSNNKKKSEVFPASTLSTKKDLILLSDIGLDVDDNNYKRLIQFFSGLLRYNENKIPTSHMVNRLGHVEGGFIHPNIDTNIEIIPNGQGEKDIINSFKEKGTLNTWKNEVLEIIKPHPKAMLFLTASFTSILLEFYGIDSFIVDFSGHTSQGKTTLLRVAASVWGNQNLINEWNTTRVAVERKAAFLNSYPLLMDDTKKQPNKKEIENIVYMFSGGRARGRGKKEDGVKKELTWKTIMLSTGETDIKEYAKAGGVAGRVISINDEPFGKYNAKRFKDIYNGIANNHGVVGRAFVELWNSLDEAYKEQLQNRYHSVTNEYIKASQGNEVLSKLATNYAAIHCTGELLNDMFDFGIDTNDFKRLFLIDKEENTALDKPKEQLVELLEILQSSPSNIFYKNRETPRVIDAFYLDDGFYLMTPFVKRIFGADEKAIRKEWLKRGYTIQNPKDKTDTLSKKVGGSSKRGIKINTDFINKLGIDFEPID